MPLLAAAVLGVLMLAGPGYAQESPTLRAFVRHDSVFLYHDALPATGRGFHVYRRQSGAEWEQLTPIPIRPVEQPEALGTVLGSRLYADVRDALGQTTEVGTLYRLRTDRFNAMALARLHPEVAQAMGQLYVDRAAPMGATVAYRLEFVDGTGRPTGRSVEGTATLTPLVPPAATGLAVEYGETGVRLSWRFPRPVAGVADDGVAYFDVYRAGGEGQPSVKLNERPVFRLFDREQFSFDYAALPDGRMEALFVVAVAVTGEEGPASEAAQLELTDRFAPGLVTGVRAVSRPGVGVELTWAAAIEPDVAGYRVYRAPEIDGQYEPLVPGILGPGDMLFVDTTAAEGRSWFYRVAALDEAGNEGRPSNAVVAAVDDRSPPPAPSDPVVDYLPEEDAVRIQWRAPGAPGPADEAESYVVLRRREFEEAAPWAQVNVEAVHSLELLDRGVGGGGFVEGATYRYGVAAVDRARNFSDTVFVNLTIPDLTPPEPPVGVTVRSDGIRVRLLWNPSPSADATTYLVHRSTPAGADSVLARLPAAIRVLQDEAVVPGATYVYAVSAVDSLGNHGPRSAAETLLFQDASPPRSPRNLRAIASAAGGAAGVRLDWEAVVTDDLAGYLVFRADSQTGVYELITEAPVSAPGLVDPTGKGGHWYRVRAVDTSGNRSRASNPVRAQP